MNAGSHNMQTTQLTLNISLISAWFDFQSPSGDFLLTCYHNDSIGLFLAEEPSVPSLQQEPAILVENSPVTFTCTGTMGRPVATFKWLVYKNTHSHSLEEVEMSGITSFSKMSGSCSPIGKSTLAIMITSADQKVKCVVQQQAKEEVVQLSDERVLDVQCELIL